MAFHAVVMRTLEPASKDFDGFQPYSEHLLALTACLLLLVLLYSPSFVTKAIRSWWFGVASGATIYPLLITFAVLKLSSLTVQKRLAIWLVGITFFCLLGFVLRFRTVANIDGPVSPASVQVSSHLRSQGASLIQEQDDPIESWEEDLLHRSGLVDTLSIKILVSKSPVIAIFGGFGSGKTSLLNLLSIHLADKATVVSFNSWLPGSPDALITSLLGNIAAEVQKVYLYPSLRRKLRGATRAFASGVPLLKGITEIVSPYSQRDQFDDLRRSLAVLPRRIVVLLDELDRMEEDELLALLKIIRGVSRLPNLSFVCALERETVEKTIASRFALESHEFFEKFFPVSVEVPKIDEDILKSAGIERIVATFTNQEWFKQDSPDAETLRQALNEQWTRAIAPYCSNLRQIGLLANDVSVAAAPLRREVNPFDLVLIEMLRRFEPDIYKFVWQNRQALAYPSSLFRSKRYVSDEEAKASEAKAQRELDEIVTNISRREQVESILKVLFPRYKAKRAESDEQRAAARVSQRICHPEYLAAYFRYELPQDLFGSREMDIFQQRLNDAPSQATREQIYRQTLLSFPKESPKRDDFLRQLSEAAKTMDPDVAQDVAYAAAAAANEFTYDLFHSVAESGHALRFIIAVASRLSKAQRASFLARCISESTDDTFALRITTDLTDPKKSGVDLGVSLDELRAPFVERMRRRYAPSARAGELDLKTADPQAFYYWANLGPEEQRLQAEFWLSYVGTSRAKLAFAFGTFLMPEGFAYSTDPEPLVEKMLPISELHRLYSELPEEHALTDVERKSLRRLKRFLDGEFKNGTPVGYEEDWDQDQAF
jgi:hypothetical protein